MGRCVQIEVLPTLGTFKMGQTLGRIQRLLDTRRTRRRQRQIEQNTRLSVEETNPDDYLSFCCSNSPRCAELVTRQGNQRLDPELEVDALRRENEDLRSVCRRLNGKSNIFLV
ncbi:uncharacterized protein LOC144912422 isoform X2 [Branchiostoma floridae x Branchiostoma belcheri]